MTFSEKEYAAEMKNDSDFRSGFYCGMAVGAALACMALALGLFVAWL